MAAKKQWHSESDLQLRKAVIDRIRRLFELGNSHVLLKGNFPDFVKRLELVLYKNAESREEYVNPTTLVERLKLITRKLQAQQRPGPPAPCSGLQELPSLQMPSVLQQSQPEVNRTSAGSLMLPHASGPPTHPDGAHIAPHQYLGPMDSTGYGKLGEDGLGCIGKRKASQMPSDASEEGWLSSLESFSGTTAQTASFFEGGDDFWVEDHSSCWHWDTGMDLDQDMGFQTGQDFLDMEDTTSLLQPPPTEGVEQQIFGSQGFVGSTGSGMELQDSTFDMFMGPDEMFHQEGLGWNSDMAMDQDSGASSQLPVAMHSTDMHGYRQCQPCFNSEHHHQQPELDMLHNPSLMHNQQMCGVPASQPPCVVMPNTHAHHTHSHAQSVRVSRDPRLAYSTAIPSNPVVIPQQRMDMDPNQGQDRCQLASVSPYAQQAVAMRTRSQGLEQLLTVTGFDSYDQAANVHDQFQTAPCGDMYAMTDAGMQQMLAHQASITPQNPNSGLNPGSVSAPSFSGRVIDPCQAAHAHAEGAYLSGYPLERCESVGGMESVDPLVHAFTCEEEECGTMCRQLGRLFDHVRSCALRKKPNQCASCSWMGMLLSLHVKRCKDKACPLPCCRSMEGSC